MFRGTRSARWVWKFVERVVADPWSQTRALLRGGPEHWHEWFGWSVDTDRQVQNTNVTIAAAGGKQTMPLPPKSQNPDLDAAFAETYAQLNS